MKKLLLFLLIIFLIECKNVQSGKEHPPGQTFFYTATIYYPNGEIDCYDIIDYNGGVGIKLIDLDGGKKIYLNIPIILELKTKE